MNNSILAMLKVLLLCVTMLISGCASEAKTSNFIRAQGQQLMVGNEVTRLKAVCFSNYYNKRDLILAESTHHEEIDFQRVHDMGFNAIRFAFNGNWYENDADAFWAWLDQNIAWARKYGIRLILDLHVPIESFWLAPASPEANFAIWTDQSIQERNINLWRAIAQRYKDETVIAGYDILNEPVTSDSTGEQWQQLAKKMVAAIREIDNNHLIIVERLYGTNQEYSNTAAVQQFLVNDDNVLYDFHFYEPIDYTHQFASWIANPLGDGGKYPDPDHLNPTGEQQLKTEARISSPTLNSAHEDWREYKSEPFQVNAEDIIAAVPILTVREGGTGMVFFDDIRIFEYDQQGNYLGEALHDPISEVSIWKWWHWQLGDSDPSHVNFKRHTDMGKNDLTSLSIQLNEFRENAVTGWSSDYNWIKVTPGHSYQLSVYMKTAPNSEFYPNATLELDFYTNPPNGKQALLSRNIEYLEHEFLKYYEFGRKHNVPISVLETGLVKHAFVDPEKGGTAWARDMLELFEKYNTSFAWWNYHGDQMGIFLSDQHQPPANPNQPLIELFKEMQGKKSATIYQESNPNAVDPSTAPPGGLAVEQTPQFVVIGFDDNTIGAGIDWVIDVFRNRYNADGTPARTSFYMNTHGLIEWIDDDPKKLLASLQRLTQSGHEIGNHTHNHHADLNQKNWNQFEKLLTKMGVEEWGGRIQHCSELLHTVGGVPKESITGFRAPYLKYNQGMLSTLAKQGFIYDTSIEEGYDQVFDGTNFRWPYTLDHGSPGHNESWQASPDNPNQIVLTNTPDLWELPNHVLIIPQDEQCQDYGIEPGLWKRMQTRMPSLRNHRITGFDYNLLVNAGLSGTEFSGILKFNLDLRLAGNRAPFMFGAHSQYYVSQRWIDSNTPHLTLNEVQTALTDFIDYALSKPEVRMRPANEVIQWCRDPKPLP